MMISRVPDAIPGVRLAISRASDAGRACVAIMTEVFNFARGLER
jgi:hypothetical protein